ncbi:MAG: phosphonate ABC transporter, permease protein PhnE [Anaerolineaceae bacterium]|nr:phosphonate ABC transporter, permease protein PhnE [Anaerolineaceae bacterium]MBN2677188.1 phosphonate ABC transporter, permease protein PhnE [Anaerolineaceae bacterium]
MKPNPNSESKKSFIVILAGLIPGLGQLLSGDFKRAGSVFLLFISTLIIVFWYSHPIWYVVPALIWLWNLWDVIKLPQEASISLVVIIWLIMIYGIGWQATEINPLALFQNTERVETIVKPMLKPDFIEPKVEEQVAFVQVQLPCKDAPPFAEKTTNGITVSADPACLNLNDTVRVEADGLWPNEQIFFEWRDPITAIMVQETHQSDAEGKFKYDFVVPPRVQGGTSNPDLSEFHRITLVQRRDIGGLKISESGGYVFQGIYETLVMALLSTTLGALLAIPFSFLAAHNLMRGNPVTMGIYYIMRFILNVTRSIEALILAIIFVVIVGLGPFPGMIALTVHTMAALGKLYSEVIEGIDPGPIEAIRATGANYLQVVRYGVIPQIVPPIVSLTVYRWDINVRTSTIIGFVGGGGIGFFLYQWINLRDFNAVSASIIAIAVVVVTMDLVSARVREKLV